jgi:hypothetical protein
MTHRVGIELVRRGVNQHESSRPDRPYLGIRGGRAQRPDRGDLGTGKDVEQSRFPSPCRTDQGDDQVR